MTAWSSFFIGNHGVAPPAVIPVSAYFFGGNEYGDASSVSILTNSMPSDVYRVAFSTLTVEQSSASFAQNFDMVATLCNATRGFTFGGHTKSLNGWNNHGFITKITWSTQAFQTLSNTYLEGPTTRNTGLNGPTFNGYIFGGIRFNSDDNTTLNSNSVDRWLWSTETMGPSSVVTDQYYRSNPTSFSSQTAGYIVAGFGDAQASDSYSNYPEEYSTNLTQAYIRGTTAFNYSQQTLAAISLTSIGEGYHTWRAYNSQTMGYFTYSTQPGFGGHEMRCSKMDFSSGTYTYNAYTVPSVFYGSHSVSNDNVKGVMVKMDPFVGGQDLRTYVQRLATHDFATDTFTTTSTAVGRPGLRLGENFQSGGYL